MKDKKRQSINVQLPRWCWWVFIGIITFFFSYLACVLAVTKFLYNSEINISHQAQLGDSFGLINALFAALAFWGVIVAMTLQRQELTLHRRELKDQKRSMKKETFERTFFHLLEMVDKKYKSIHTVHGPKIQGPEVFDRTIQWALTKGEKDYTVPLSTATKTYFLLLIKILQLVDETKFNEDTEKKFYTDILRDQMREDELETLFLLGMDHEWCSESPTIDDEALREMVAKYSLFFNIRYSKLEELFEKHNCRFDQFYHRDAFEDRPDILDFYPEVENLF